MFLVLGKEGLCCVGTCLSFCVLAPCSAKSCLRGMKTSKIWTDTYSPSRIHHPHVRHLASNHRASMLTCRRSEVAQRTLSHTHRLHSSSLLGLPYRVLNMNPQIELLWSLCVAGALAPQGSGRGRVEEVVELGVASPK